MGLERRDAVLALGGGVIGDLAGFAASIVRRGIRFVQVPTTLLAQVDSSVGGKTGLNTPQGKNLVGAFHQPSLVLADIDVLATLSPREVRAGYAEVVKYGLLGDAAFFQWLEKHGPAVVAGDAAARIEAVRVSCVAKAGVVARDETEMGERALLNLGHTFGHALEAWAGYSQRLLHGEAVAIGMVLAFGLSEELEVCPAGTTETVRSHLRRVGLPSRIAEVPSGNDGLRPDVATLLSLMRQDKKVVAGKQTLILARGIGAAYITRDVPPDVLSDYLTRALSAA
jgi:3-dehydroquinate synthase